MYACPKQWVRHSFMTSEVISCITCHRASMRRSTMQPARARKEETDRAMDERQQAQCTHTVNVKAAQAAAPMRALSSACPARPSQLAASGRAGVVAARRRRARPAQQQRAQLLLLLWHEAAARQVARHAAWLAVQPVERARHRLARCALKLGPARRAPTQPGAAAAAHAFAAALLAATTPHCMRTQRQLQRTTSCMHDSAAAAGKSPRACRGR